MKICFFSQGGNTNQGGATYSLMDVAEELIWRGHEVLVVVASTANLEKRNGIQYLAVPFYTLRWKTDAPACIQIVKCMIKDLFNRCIGILIYFMLRKKGFDIVHINGISTDIGAVFAKRISCPCVWHIRQLLEEDLGVHIYREKRMIQWMNQAAATIAVSRIVQEKFRKKLIRQPLLIYNGVPVKKYAIEDHRIFTGEMTRLLIAGRIDPGKGQMDAVRAVELLIKEETGETKSVHLTIAGNGDNKYADHLKHYIKDHGLEQWITVLPHQPDPRKMRENTDIGLICSRCEAFGRVTVETMLAKALLIGADTGATPELIKDGVTGFLYRQGDYHSLAEKIRYAVSNKENSRAIAERGYREAINHYSVERVVDQLTCLYGEIMRDNEGKRQS